MANSQKRVVLRDSRDENGTRFLEARLEGAQVVIAGQDLGRGVEAALGEGIREYEWEWRMSAARVSEALGGGEVLAQLAARFSGADAAHLGAFLDEAGIERHTWSRMGE